MENLDIKTSKISLKSPTTTPMLPPELWNQMFQYLSPEDLFSVSSTCPAWNELLEDKKTTYLFAFVLPLVMGHVERKTLFYCRSVTKASKLGFEKTLQSFCNSDDVNPFRHHHEDSISQRCLRDVACKLKRHYDFSHVNFKEFLQKVFPNFSTTSSEFNPFLLRHIVLASSRSGDVYLPGHHLLSILPKFGHHLVSLDLIIDANSIDMLISRIVSQLSLVPNLKRLAIIPSVLQGETIPIHLARPTTSYNFPKLVNLVHFNVEDVQPTGNLYCVVFTMLETYGHQLTSFACSPTFLAASFLTVNKLNTLFPNIKKFQLSGVRLDFSQALSKLSEVSWPLVHLHLQMSYLTGWKEVNMLDAQKVFSAVNNFHKNLMHLHVNCMLLPSRANSNVNNKTETVEIYKPMSKLKIIITNAHNMERGIFCKFLKENCQYLHQLHIETWDIKERDKGRWVFEHMRNLEKVVLWNLNVSSFNELGRTHTVRRCTRPNSEVMADSGITERK
ncbi:unnamed protein product [Orchesella dallaii]|uniref:F-box domain-containing protein n=1 Tax=Orchesella dallaii TaxID=48710 RepID=A0ABP1QGB1_9HEXA